MRRDNRKYYECLHNEEPVLLCAESAAVELDGLIIETCESRPIKAPLTLAC
jgi:hypothetical protein